MSDFLPTADWPALRLRAEMLRRVRGFFDARGFLEVETPILSADVVVDRHLDPLLTEFVPLAGAATGRRPLYLQTSPEFAMKRLLAAGGEAIYQVAHAFRQGEVGRLHNPEFTIVEWYRQRDDLAAGMQLLSDLAEALLERGPADRVTYADAFRQAAGVDPHRDSIDALRAALKKRGIVPPANLELEDRDGWLDLLLVELVEPTLGRPRPTILYDYPPSQAALARVRTANPPVAERFELYADGIELANGYHELLDADVLRARNRENNALRVRDGKSALPETSRLLQAMDYGLPPSTGVALGFDRCVMLAAGVNDIREVLPFPIDRA
jgi:elongation factor P--(R)-beta-lysine ligase